MNTSLRVKMVLGFLVIVLVMGISAATISIHLTGKWFFFQTRERLESDLSSAREVYADKTREVLTILSFTALRPVTVKRALVTRDIPTLLAALREVRSVSGLDILTLTDADGTVVVRAHNPGLARDNLRDDGAVKRVLATGRTVTGTALIRRETLMVEDPGLTGRLTREAQSVTDNATVFDAGMMIEAAVPIHDGDTLIGILAGGKLINGDDTIINGISTIVFSTERNPAGDIGTIALYQGPECIAATPSTHGDGTAGIAVPPAIFADLAAGRSRMTIRTSVAGERLITAYEAIRGFDGAVIGALSVGIFEHSLISLRKRQALIIAGVLLVSVVCAFAAWFIFSKSIVRPIRQLADRAQQMVDAKSDTHVAHHNPDEVIAMGNALNYFLTSIQEQDTRIRTIRREINQTRRLSTLGRLAAGVAHEINNPLGGIIVFASLLLEDMPADDPNRSHVEKVIREANRCKNIVKSLLDFARQNHPLLASADVNAILGEALANLRRVPGNERVSFVDRRDPALPPVQADASQIQEVFENIVRNAVEAMDHAGTVVIMTSVKIDAEGERVVEARFEDSGPGIALENLNHVFDPFFTTKKCGHGTGLGLAVSYGIIERHGGSISVRNNLSGGAIFIVHLPLGTGTA